MLGDKLIRAYRKLRSEGHSARNCWLMAKGEIEAESLPYCGYDGEEWDQDGFTLKLSVEPDDFDISWLAKLTDHPRAGEDAVKRKNARRYEYQYLVLEREYDPSDYRKLGYARHDAWLRSRRDRLADIDLAEKLIEEGFWHVKVTAYDDDGDELGSASIGSVDQDYVKAAIRDYSLVEQAIAQAKDQVEQDMLASMASTY